MSLFRPGLASLILVAGCSAANTAPTETIGTTSSAITEGTVLSRADEWVQAKLLYCQSPNGQSDTIDPSCPSVCMRESNAEWDPYRSDCSGFVSWAWGLPPPGNTTDEFAPADTSVSYVIQGSELQPGDALNIPGDHIVLFVSWVTPGSEANFYEEPGCSATPDYAHAFTSAVTISGSSVTIAYEGSTFTAIRYTGITAGDGGVVDSGVAMANDSGIGTPCTVSTTGASGVCLETATCAAMSGTSTPDYCPGPDDVQCCTMVPDADGEGDAGAATSTSSTSTSAGSGTGVGTETVSESSSASGKVLPGSPVVDAGRRSSEEPETTPSTDAGSTGGCAMSPRSSEPAPAAWLSLFASIAALGARRRSRGRPL